MNYKNFDCYELFFCMVITVAVAWIFGCEHKMYLQRAEQVTQNSDQDGPYFLKTDVPLWQSGLVATIE